MKKQGGIETRGNKKTNDTKLASLGRVFGKQKYPVSALYIFGNLTIIDKFGRVLLVLNEDRMDRKIYVPVGGEVKIREGQTLHKAVVDESYEELGLTIDPRKLVLIGEPQMIIPSDQYNPYPAKYVKGGAGLIIFSYAYKGNLEKQEIKINTVPEEGSMVVEYAWVALPNTRKDINDIKNLGIFLYPNYADKLLELNKMIQRGKL